MGASKLKHLFRRSEADKAKATRFAVVVLHDLGRGDCAIRCELRAQAVIIHVICKILDVEVHALIFCNFLIAGIIKPTRQSHSVSLVPGRLEKAAWLLAGP